ncbi:MAG: Coenzyme F420 hydrogenase/dehydrogenase, beta subunit C-terminal domain [Chloroflexi bacterium]|nr:Coenzyme F420 hydrogenase/dehydrogenase, beta subunit C-terminal domain [Chloroflexota bacterium]
MSPDKKAKPSGFDALRREVIGAGLCTACGACIGVCPAKCIKFDYEMEEPVLSGECQPCGLCHLVCAGKDIPMPQMERMLFSRERSLEEESLGVWRSRLIGYAGDPLIRQSGTSGGCATALLTYALEAGIIDGALCVGMSAAQPWRAIPRLATKSSEILDSAKSKYVVVPVNALLNEARQRGIKKLGIVGLPCHIHALRKMQMHGQPGSVLRNIEFAIGLFCGSGFSFATTRHLIAKFAGVPLTNIARLEYRGGPNSEDMYVTTVDGLKKIIPGKERTSINLRTRRDRCTVCLDFSAELADVSIGDIFVAGGKGRLPHYSAMLVRTEAGDSLVGGAEKAGYIKTSPLKPSGFYYNIGLELKKQLLPHFFLERKRVGWPIPDYHREINPLPPRLISEEDAVSEQKSQIPEVAEWLARKPES